VLRELRGSTVTAPAPSQCQSLLALGS
jgi:hypothetical protein